MTPSLSRHQIRLNLIDAVIDFVNGVRLESETTEEQKSFLQLLHIYRNDTLRKMRGLPGSLDYLWDHLKVGVRLAGSIMAIVQEQEAESLVGWYMGCEPQNFEQAFYNLVGETATQLAWSILEVESQFPEMKTEFNMERAAYQRIHEQWRKEDEAALEAERID